MFSVLNLLRYRKTIFLILGFIFILLFAYYYAATNDVMAMWITKHQSSASQLVLSISNTNGQIQVNSSSMNTSSVSEDPSKYSTTPNPDDLTAAFYQTGHSVSIPEKCPDSGNGLEVLILIMSTPSNVQPRQAIRLTWGHFGQRKDVRIAFFLGNVTTDSKVEEALLNEEEIYGDIIRGNFFDSYSNLPLKVISAFEWVTEYCPEAKFVLKTDDDMFINVPLLLEFIKNHSTERNVIFGRLADGWKPERNKNSKYYIGKEEFDKKVYPNFTSGPAYLLSNDVIPKLYNATLEEKYLKLEDVLITGIVAEKLGIQRLNDAPFVNQRIKFVPCKIRSSISIHSIKYNEQFDLWKKLFDDKIKCG